MHALLVDRAGRVWIGTGHGLDLFDPRSGRLRHFQQQPERPDGLAGNLVRALWQGPDGAIWVGSHGGLNRVDVDADGVPHFRQPLSAALQGQALPVVFSLSGDSGNDIWMGTDRGLLRYTPRTGALRSYVLTDGLQDLEFNGGAVAALRRWPAGVRRRLRRECVRPGADHRQHPAAATAAAVGAGRRAG